MKKTFRMMLLAMCCLFSASAMAKNENAVVLKLASGEVVSFSFDECTKITYSGNDMVITTGETSVSYSMDELTCTFDEVQTTAIEETQTAKTEFAIKGGNVSTTGLNAGQVVNVFSANGTKVATIKADAEGNATVSLPGKGAYIVNTGKITYKIATK